jgi:hypothetical protein
LVREETLPNYKQIMPPWDGEHDAELYVGFVDRLIGLSPKPTYINHSPSYQPPPKHDYVVQLLESGKALKQEMQENGYDDATPNCMPHSAFTAFFDTWEKVYLAALGPICLIAVELGQASTLEWAALKAPWRVCDQFPKYRPFLGALTPLPSPAMEIKVKFDPPSTAPEPSPLRLNPLDDLDVHEAIPLHHS